MQSTVHHIARKLAKASVLTHMLPYEVRLGARRS
jgi:hypothetical protein